MNYRYLDIEAIGLRPFGGVVWMVSWFDLKRLRVFHNCFGMTRKDLPENIIREMEDPTICKVIQNAEYDGPYIELVLGIRIRNIADTRLNEIVIQGFQLARRKTKEMTPYQLAEYKAHSSSLEYTALRYGLPQLDKTITKNFIGRPKGTSFSKAEIDYAGMDTKILAPLLTAQTYILERDQQLEVALLEGKVVEGVIRMRVNGLGISTQLWRAQVEEDLATMRKIENALPKQVKNWNSPAQVKQFFRNRGILIPSFDDLETVYETTHDPILGEFLKLRELFTATTKYGLKWIGPEFVDADGRIRCNWEQIVDTGRMAVSNPPIHGLPQKSPLMHRRRACFVPRKGYSYVIGDYPSQELGIMAARAGERLWIDALKRGDDVHAVTASIIFQDQWEHGREKGCTFPRKCKCKGHQGPRSLTKTLNYMLAYGGGVTKFMFLTGKQKIESAKIMGRHARAVPLVTRMLDRDGKDAIATRVSYSGDPYKRRRVIRESEEYRLRNTGMNNPVQAAAANMVKLAVISLPEKFADFLVFIWHDEIVLEVPINLCKVACKVLKKSMERSADYITGIEGLLQVEPRIAKNLLKE